MAAQVSLVLIRVEEQTSPSVTTEDVCGGPLVRKTPHGLGWGWAPVGSLSSRSTGAGQSGRGLVGGTPGWAGTCCGETPTGS